MFIYTKIHIWSASNQLEVPKTIRIIQKKKKDNGDSKTFSEAINKDFF